MLVEVVKVCFGISLIAELAGVLLITVLAFAFSFKVLSRNVYAYASKQDRADDTRVLLTRLGSYRDTARPKEELVAP